MPHMQITLCAHETDMFIYIHSYELTAITIWLGALVYMHSTLLAYAPEQMSATLHKYDILDFCCSLHVDPWLLQTYSKKINKLKYLFTILLQNMPLTTNMLSNVTWMSFTQITQCALMGEECPIYMPLIKSLASTMWQWVLCWQKWHQCKHWHRC